MCILIVPVALVVCLLGKKVWSVRLVLISILSVICVLVQGGLCRMMFKFKHSACITIVSRGQVLIDAISSYQQDHKSYPESLEALVPAYIDKIPETGIRGFPYFEYEILDPAKYKYPITEMGDRPIWELQVRLYSPFKWDCIFYWPVDKYPDSIYGGGTEKIGEWAFVNE
jgi:hypothetical protein